MSIRIPSFANEAEKIRYWNSRTIAEKLQATMQLTREHYRKLGIDVDAPMQKTLRRITWDEKNRQHEEAHRLYEQMREES